MGPFLQNQSISTGMRLVVAPAVRMLCASPCACVIRDSGAPMMTVDTRGQPIALLNPCAVKLDDALGRMQGCDDIGGACLYRDACEPDGVVSRLQLDRSRVGDGNAL
jgi:hypothetical protein